MSEHPPLDQGLHRLILGLVDNMDKHFTQAHESTQRLSVDINEGFNRMEQALSRIERQNSGRDEENISDLYRSFSHFQQFVQGLGHYISSNMPPTMMPTGGLQPANSSGASLPTAAESPSVQDHSQPPSPCSIARFTEHGRAPPQYKLNSTVETVARFWDEYTVGIFGGPAIRDLEQKYGDGWRRNKTDNRQWNRRKIIIEEILRLVREGKSEPDAVDAVEAIRCSLSLPARKQTLWALQEHLKKIETINKNP